MDINFAMTTVKLPDDKEELLALIDQCQAQIKSINKVETERRREEQKKFDAQYRKEFGARLKAAREGVGLSQSEMAKKLGTAKSTYINYEHGYREPSILTIRLLTKILNVSAGYLFGLNENFKGD